MTHDSTKPIKMERFYDASLEDVWDLWTTQEGIESWWGPDGFIVKVNKMDVRPGGVLEYAMIAVGEQQIAFMKKAGMPTSTITTITYKEIVKHQKLLYTNRADFIPGVAPYDVDTCVELSLAPNGVRLLLTIHPMHDEIWTGRQAAGWEMELGKLGRLIAERKK